ncbi:N-(5'-phosphoribosyl)anthranilate isomerase [Posidoniimonas polymericola]|uniref:N-(5'-phosphoribosyl)anthranilate isomerase n=1 Tax=Posidoniimonas polymericola TaxID=2528002 RepID=A0A5C5YI97_9BACT|nr:phosphoribosylanthranilate isomerase [Posidoniimonas polymericola]TWT74594.1 N-(5'-phosphoribosyl)anthranilate isomerase [Posidoniimonas polymericola]
MFRVKICGVTSIDDAEMIDAAGADAIGLNFYPQSPRCVTAEFASLVAEALADRVQRVGLFVNEPADRVRELAKRCRLSAVQLHGDEPLSMIAELEPLPVVLARRLTRETLPAFAAELAALPAAALPAALLVDAAVPGHYGGSGQTADWGALAGHDHWRRGVPMILAGGLRAENVAQAVAAVRPHGVDTASGVESAPGVKDPAQTADFISAARRAFGLAAAD